MSSQVMSTDPNYITHVLCVNVHVCMFIIVIDTMAQQVHFYSVLYIHIYTHISSFVVD